MCHYGGQVAYMETDPNWYKSPPILDHDLYKITTSSRPLTYIYIYMLYSPPLKKPTSLTTVWCSSLIFDFVIKPWHVLKTQANVHKKSMHPPCPLALGFFYELIFIVYSTSQTMNGKKWLQVTDELVEFEGYRLKCKTSRKLLIILEEYVEYTSI